MEMGGEGRKGRCKKVKGDPPEQKFLATACGICIGLRLFVMKTENTAKIQTTVTMSVLNCF